MSLKDTIISWNNGVEAAIAGNLDQAISEWKGMAEPGAKIYYNMASMHLKKGQLDEAIRCLDVSVKKDSHLALAFFQRGCLLLQKRKYDSALSDFDKTMTNLRGNAFIDYKQLGLQYKLYACEVMFNQAYALVKTGRVPEAMEELQRAKSKAAVSESRHKIISPALDGVMAGRTNFQAYELPDRALVFQPPRNKTEVLKPVTFIAPARVLASVVDQDSYTGFVGVQDKVNRSRSPSPSASPVPKPRNNQKPDRQPKPDKPDVPPPKTTAGIKVHGRNSSLHGEESRPTNLSKAASDEFKKVVVAGKGQAGKGGGGSGSLARPPMPGVAPPPFHPEGNVRRTPKPKSPVKQKSNDSLLPPKRPPKSPLPRSPSPAGERQLGQQMTVKVHYSSTRAIRVNTSVKFADLDKAICKKFGNPQGSLTFYSKKRSGELLEVNSDATLKELTSSLEDGFRLTLWAYDKHESSPEVEDVVLKVVIARFAYTPQYEDELAFSAGDRINVTVDINDDWYEGRLDETTGIFPKSYVKDA